MKQADDKQLLQADPDLAELDRELAQMAEEVPPMPDDFHENWMKAVRAEAAKTQNQGPAAAKPEGKAVRMASSPWFRALSMAAVFVFLIGGTLAYRSSKKRIAPVARQEAQDPAAAGAQDAAQPVLEMAGEEAADSAMEAMEEESEEEIVFYEDGFSMPMAESCEEAASDGEETDAEEEEPAAMNAAVPQLRKEAAAGTAMPGENAGSETIAAMKTAEEETPEEIPAPEASAEASEGFLQAFGGFMADMGAFLLAALPYLAGLALVAAVIALVRRRGGKG